MVVFRKEEIHSYNATKYKFYWDDNEEFTFADFINILKSESQNELPKAKRFVKKLDEALKENCVEPFFWECPPVCGNSFIKTQFEFVITKGFLSNRQNFGSFLEHFENQTSGK